MNKIKIVAAFAVFAIVGVAFAGPHGPGGFHGGPGPGFHHGPVHHQGGFWGRGGSHFWPGFVGGVVGGIVGTAVAQPVVVTTPTVVTAPTVVAAPTVVTTPVVTTPVVTQTVVAQPVQTIQNVWVEGRYVDQVQANGTIIRTWQPGHYEQRTVVVQ